MSNFCVAATIAVEASESIQAPGVLLSVLIPLSSVLLWGFKKAWEKEPVQLFLTIKRNLCTNDVIL